MTVRSDIDDRLLEAALVAVQHVLQVEHMP